MTAPPLSAITRRYDLLHFACVCSTSLTHGLTFLWLWCGGVMQPHVVSGVMGSGGFDEKTCSAIAKDDFFQSGSMCTLITTCVCCSLFYRFCSA